jgi:hypothetical protein
VILFPAPVATCAHSEILFPEAAATCAHSEM